ncbi:MAG TPA: protein-L-isoaspartate(D-aspartate) O-methyltransferase [Kofleriaceae bacterium]|nr:protein-L-isoaspartate(D-aspartate) O-methyltransferase [Kofleriaceae bacterium]
MMDLTTARAAMVDRHVRNRGVRDPRVLAAMGTVPREAFLPPDLAESAYEDRPLPIDAGQTISQPYIVALMTEALGLDGDERVLEIGTGSGYAAAVLGHVAREVYTVERHEVLANVARERLAALGYANIHVRCGDGTLGWHDHAPYDAIIVAAGGPDLPRALLDQLAVRGRLVMPVGSGRAQELVRVTRVSDTEYRRENLGAVVFVPLIGAQGWSEPADPEQARRRRGILPRRNPGPLATPTPASRPSTIAKLIGECAEPIARIDDVALDGLLERIGDARVVLLGEATHGTSEFYRMRTRLTQELILRHGFRGVAIEGDWPDAAAVDRYVRGKPPRERRWVPFARFPTWMWRNTETQQLIEWLHAYNAETHRDVSFSGLDLYSMYTSAYEVVRYLDRVDPDAAKAARDRYGRLTPWEHDPAAYGQAALVGRMRSCENDVVAMLRDLLAKRLEYSQQDGDEFFDAAQNARVVAGAEGYYRTMYYGAAESWNLRDQHMFDTLRSLLAHRGDDAKLVVWEHNSHVGDASATEMAVRGEHNIGQLCREAFGDACYAVGFGTDHGTVAAADAWEEPMQVMQVRPARADSYERLCHDAGVPAFLLHLRDPVREELRDELSDPRLERAIGVIYRPATELQSHYFQAVLPAQFDEYIWFDETEAVHPLVLGESATPRAPHPLAP